VQKLRTPSAISLALALLITVAGCGQFFPSSSTITALQISPTSAVVQPGVTQQYSATATYGNNTTGDVTSQVTWSSSLTTVAMINSSGLLTAAALGTATIKAQSGSVIASTPVTVAQKTVTSVTISPLTQTLSLSLGPTTVQFTATATYSDSTMANVTSIATWTSTPTSVASISTAGLATAVSVGTSSVTATSGGVTSNAATITVIQ
jgi:hypothetical protein